MNGAAWQLPKNDYFFCSNYTNLFGQSLEPDEKS